MFLISSIIKSEEHPQSSAFFLYFGVSHASSQKEFFTLQTFLSIHSIHPMLLHQPCSYALTAATVFAFSVRFLNVARRS